MKNVFEVNNSMEAKGEGDLSVTLLPGTVIWFRDRVDKPREVVILSPVFSYVDHSLNTGYFMETIHLFKGFFDNLRKLTPEEIEYYSMFENYQSGNSEPVVPSSSVDLRQPQEDSMWHEPHFLEQKTKPQNSTVEEISLRQPQILTGWGGSPVGDSNRSVDKPGWHDADWDAEFF